MENTNTKYSQSLLLELEKHLDPELVDYFEITKSYHSYTYDDIASFIEHILTTYNFDAFKNTKVYYDKELDNRRKRRKDWVKKTKDNREKYTFVNPQSFFHHIHQDLLTNDRRQFYIDSYGTTNISEIIDEIIKKMDRWLEQRQYLIKFPNYPYIGKINQASILKSDLFINLYEIVSDKFNGNLNYIQFKSPLDMIVNPVFSAQRGRVKIKADENNKLVSELFSSQSYKVSLLGIPIDTDKEYESSVPVLDSIDLGIVSYLINNTYIDITASSPIIPTQLCKLTDITQVVLRTKHATEDQKNNIRKRLVRLQSQILIRAVDQSDTVAYSILSSVRIFKNPDTNSVEVEYTLGPQLSNSILENKILKLSSSRYNSLVSPASKSLYPQLQIERIAKALSGKDMTGIYSYNRMVQMMLLRSASRKRNMEIINATLTDIKENGEIIQEYQIKGPDIIVRYTPVTSQEMLEFADEKKYIESLD